MKLAELKKRFQNRYVIRMVAGVLTIAMVGSGTAVCNVYAAKKQDALKTESPAEEDEVKLEDFLSKGNAAETKEIGKDETVYILADSDGTARTTIVSEWLKNPKARTCLLTNLIYLILKM